MPPRGIMRPSPGAVLAAAPTPAARRDDRYPLPQPRALLRKPSRTRNIDAEATWLARSSSRAPHTRQLPLV